MSDTHPIPNFAIFGRDPNIRHDADSLVPKTALSSTTIVDISETDAQTGNLHYHLCRAKFAVYGFMQCDITRLGTMIN